MEWIGWWFEWRAKSVLQEAMGGGDGPSFGRTRVDYQNTMVWDLKAHVEEYGGKDWVIVNDQEAVRASIREYGGFGVIICHGEAELDSDRSFQKWHDVLKGEQSAYVKERVRRRAPSRLRKRSFEVNGYMAAFFDATSLEAAIEAGLVRGFQEGMRNSNGTPRRSKFMVDLNAIRDSSLLVSQA